MCPGCGDKDCNDPACLTRATWNPSKPLKTPTGRIVGGAVRVYPLSNGGFRLEFREVIRRMGWRPQLITRYIVKEPMQHMEVAA